MSDVPPLELVRAGIKHQTANLELSQHGITI